MLGVDFDTYLSQWGNSCPSESFKTSLEDRSRDILRKLRASGVGRRPVVFVGHSMGGLVIKRMLTRARESEDEAERAVASNTRGVVFYSTPHLGSRVAKLNSYSKYLFFPTTEVQDLEAGSPQLADLHHTFVDLVNARKIKVCAFNFEIVGKHICFFKVMLVWLRWSASERRWRRPTWAWTLRSCRQSPRGRPWEATTSWR